MSGSGQWVMQPRRIHAGRNRLSRGSMTEPVNRTSSATTPTLVLSTMRTICGVARVWLLLTMIVPFMSRTAAIQANFSRGIAGMLVAPFGERLTLAWPCGAVGRAPGEFAGAGDVVAGFWVTAGAQPPGGLQGLTAGGAHRAGRRIVPPGVVRRHLFGCDLTPGLSAHAPQAEGTAPGGRDVTVTRAAGGTGSEGTERRGLATLRLDRLMVTGGIDLQRLRVVLAGLGHVAADRVGQPDGLDVHRDVPRPGVALLDRVGDHAVR